jgi:hypothetical protein
MIVQSKEYNYKCKSGEGKREYAPRLLTALQEDKGNH